MLNPDEFNDHAFYNIPLDINDSKETKALEVTAVDNNKRLGSNKCKIQLMEWK